jgi:hypothetical protein
MADTFNKRFTSGDVFTIPYTANKQWDITSSLFPEYNIFIELGTYPTTSIQNYNRENLIYKSVLANFYNELYPTLSLSTSSYYQTTNYTSSLTSNDYAISGGLRIGNLATTEKYYPIGTKIGINDNSVSINDPSILQGAFRFFKGDGREDLHNLYLPIIKSIEWYWDDMNPEINNLFEGAIAGLNSLKL